MIKTKQYAILILSCDKFSDLWKPFFNLFWKNWSDIPFNIYLGSNTVKYNDKKVKTILSGKDIDWATSLKAILNKIPEKYLFVWVEDGFITSKVDSLRLVKILKYMKKEKIKHIHMRPSPKPDKFLNKDYGIYEKGTPYRVNVVGFWEKNYLTKLLIKGENSWNFEIMGSYRASYDEGFYCLMKPFFNYIHLVEKGFLHWEGVKYCLEHKIPLNIDSRRISGTGYRLKSKLQTMYFDLISRFNWRFRVKLMYLLRKLIISY